MAPPITRFVLGNLTPPAALGRVALTLLGAHLPHRVACAWGQVLGLGHRGGPRTRTPAGGPSQRRPNEKPGVDVDDGIHAWTSPSGRPVGHSCRMHRAPEGPEAEDDHGHSGAESPGGGGPGPVPRAIRYDRGGRHRRGHPRQCARAPAGGAAPSSRWPGVQQGPASIRRGLGHCGQLPGASWPGRGQHGKPGAGRSQSRVKVFSLTLTPGWSVCARPPTASQEAGTSIPVAPDCLVGHRAPPPQGPRWRGGLREKPEASPSPEDGGRSETRPRRESQHDRHARPGSGS